MEELKAAFPQLPIPQTISSSNREENQLACRMLEGKKWTELKRDEMQTIWGGANISSILTYLAPEAFCYYLPFFMDIAISGDGDALDDLINNLSSTNERTVARIRHLTEDQSRLVAEFVVECESLYSQNYVVNPFPALLSGYWENFLPKRI